MNNTLRHLLFCLNCFFILLLMYVMAGGKILALTGVWLIPGIALLFYNQVWFSLLGGKSLYKIILLGECVDGTLLISRYSSYSFAVLCFFFGVIRSLGYTDTGVEEFSSLLAADLSSVSLPILVQLTFWEPFCLFNLKSRKFSIREFTPTAVFLTLAIFAIVVLEAN